MECTYRMDCPHCSWLNCISCECAEPAYTYPSEDNTEMTPEEQAEWETVLDELGLTEDDLPF